VDFIDMTDDCKFKYLSLSPVRAHVHVFPWVPWDPVGVRYLFVGSFRINNSSLFLAL
jgi:hypothetical protein